MVNCEYKKLKGKITEVFGSQVAFADKLGISATYLSSKLNCKIGITPDDMVDWCKALDIPVEDIGLYFFA